MDIPERKEIESGKGLREHLDRFLIAKEKDYNEAVEGGPETIKIAQQEYLDICRMLTEIMNYYEHFTPRPVLKKETIDKMMGQED